MQILFEKMSVVARTLPCPITLKHFSVIEIYSMDPKGGIITVIGTTVYFYTNLYTLHNRWKTFWTKYDVEASTERKTVNLAHRRKKYEYWLKQKSGWVLGCLKMNKALLLLLIRSAKF